MERIRFNDLTDEEKEMICNGCGPKGGLIPIPNFRFEASCNHHDFNYYIGCTEKQRKKADKQFLAAMRLDAGRNIYYRVWAYTYYMAVRAFGKKCFYYGPSQRFVKRYKVNK